MHIKSCFTYDCSTIFFAVAERSLIVQTLLKHSAQSAFEKQRDGRNEHPRRPVKFRAGTNSADVSQHPGTPMKSFSDLGMVGTRGGCQEVSSLEAYLTKWSWIHVWVFSPTTTLLFNRWANLRTISSLWVKSPSPRRSRTNELSPAFESK